MRGFAAVPFITLFVVAFAVRPGQAYRIRVGREERILTASSETLAFPLDLAGPTHVSVTIAAEDQASSFQSPR